MGMSGIPQPLGWEKVKAIQDKILAIDQQSDRILELLIEKEKEFSESKHRTFLKGSIEGLLNELSYNYIRNSNALYAELVPLLVNIFRAGWMSGANKVSSKTNKIIVEQRIKGNIKTNKEFEKEFEKEKKKLKKKITRFYESNISKTLKYKCNVTSHLKGKYPKQQIDSKKLYYLPDKLKLEGRSYLRKELGNSIQAGNIIKEVFRPPKISKRREYNTGDYY